jgi:TolB-like protein/DNA-binding winged helix-turn-helix (wHTH) protein
MPENGEHRPSVRFDRFEMDFRRGELRKDGQRVKLQGQPFHLLSMLLRQPGEVVTREELRNQIWPQDIFVDFDAGLYTAVKKLRLALNDIANEPCFIETIPRRGYRFVGAVEKLPLRAVSAVIASSPEDAADDGGGVAGPRIPATAAENAGRRLVPGLGWKIALLITACVVLAVSWRATPAAWRERLKGDRMRLHAVAVLPFENLSGDASQDYVADGISDFLTTDLAKVHQLRVISRTSASRYRKAGKAVPEIARELGVDAIVEGTFLRSENRVRVTVQLIDAQTDRHLWANNYERDASNLFALQSELGHAVAREVAIHLSPAEEAAFVSGHTVNPDAWDSYVKGRFFFSQRTRAGYRQSCQYFEESIARDQAFAPAYAALAECTYQMGSFGLLPLQESILKAKAIALQAVELDRNSSQARVALAWVLLYGEWNWEGAHKEIIRALELDPNNAGAHGVYCSYLWAMGNKAETVSEAKKIKELDPLNPASATSLGWFLLWTGNDHLAEPEFREALSLDPNTILAHVGLAEIYARRRLFDQAATERFAGLSHSSSEPPAVARTFLTTYKEQGYQAAVHFFLQYQLKQAQDEARLGQPAACDLGIAYADLGDKKNALYWMERGLGEHCRQMMVVKSVPRFDFLRNEPRFQALLQRMNLDPSR